MLVQVGIATSASDLGVADTLVRPLVERGITTILLPLEQLFGALEGKKAPFRCLILVGGKGVNTLLIQRIRECSMVEFVLAIDASFTRERKSRLIAAGVDDCADATELDVVVARVTSLLRRSTSRTQPSVRAENHRAGEGAPRVEFDFSNQVVSIGDVSATLTRRELSLLKYMADRPNCWLSHSEVREAVFGASCVGDSTLVRVHLCSIRRKLGKAGELLRTERYRGTMLWLDGLVTTQSA